MSLRIVIPLIIIIFDFSSHSTAQDIHLKSGNKFKTIKAGTFIEIELPTPNQEPCAKCKYNFMAGELISSAGDKVTLRVIESLEPLVEEKENVGWVEKKYMAKGKGRVLSIPNDIILSIKQRGKKKLREYKTGGVIGMVLAILGSSQLVAAAINELDEGSQGNLLWISGGAELLTGITLIGVFGQKLYITSFDCPQKLAGQAVWEIN
ncbi:MAG TPA: hypothetical protein VM101_13105 [Flavitalea sp.]|nr:hypothetical protein [Flavitalea sp.]